MKKTIALILVISTMILLFAGCKVSPNTPATTIAPTGPIDDPYGEEEEVPSTPVPQGAELFSIDGNPVYEAEFRLWVNQALAYQGIDPAGEVDWEMAVPNSILSLRDYIKSEAEQSARIYRAVILNAEDMGLELSEEDQEYIDNIKEEYMGYLNGDEQAYLQYLADAGLNEELLKYTETVSILYQKIQQQLLADGSVTDEEALTLGEESGVLRAKHILIKFPESVDGSAPTDEQKQETLAKAQEIYAQLAAITDKDALLNGFDTQMQELSEDPGKVSNPDGYQFVEGVMVQSFTDTTAALAFNEISEPVDIEYGYSIILRLPLVPDMEVMSAYSSGGTLRDGAANVAIQEEINEWAESLTIATTVEYDNLDIPSFALGN
ncbi:MAG: peptidylprolyl isomerase [Oscillospiraceae bacterium]|jgi:hypothetical protein|nr:peptidylprolyl isomerase [Oscillospiraceae bacterium]